MRWPRNFDGSVLHGSRREGLGSILTSAHINIIKEEEGVRVHAPAHVHTGITMRSMLQRGGPCWCLVKEVMLWLCHPSQPAVEDIMYVRTKTLR